MAQSLGFFPSNLQYCIFTFGTISQGQFMNQKSKPLVVGDQSFIWVLGLYCYILEEFYKDN